MSHDLVAELGGYRDELAEAKRLKQTERAEAVQAEIDRVAAAVNANAEALETRAQSLDGDGQDALAGQAREEARALREAAGGPENASDSSPLERAVPKKART